MLYRGTIRLGSLGAIFPADEQITMTANQKSLEFKSLTHFKCKTAACKLRKNMTLSSVGVYANKVWQRLRIFVCKPWKPVSILGLPVHCPKLFFLVNRLK